MKTLIISFLLCVPGLSAEADFPVAWLLTPSSWQVGGADTLANGFCYNTDTNFGTWQDRIPGDIDCEAELPDNTKLKGSKPQSVLFDTTCQIRYALGVSYNDNQEYAMGYSALISYLETCYDTARSWQGFGVNCAPFFGQ